ncbi:hypothetical protein [Nitrosomonas sp. sh817]|uniref:hypothetical protein n=1 Tax=Nitrosomonas sp. sh817 TaxID=3070658 RepID=UPI0027DB0241|nr:hypothetical protein [Nitrosomonas sp. sh817]WMJ08583.1 hypothetical protein RBH92_14335 [Nitrosomonas sp. sh817]
MKEVFLPLNKQRMDIILSEAALIDHAHKIPDYLIDLVNHVSELNAMMKRWETITDARHAMSFVDNNADTPKERYAAFYPSCEFPTELNRELEKKHAHLIYQKNTLLDAWNQKEKRD